jgi:hypothetical protein
MNKKYLIPLIALVLIVGTALVYFRIEQRKITTLRDNLAKEGLVAKEDAKTFKSFLADNEDNVQKLASGKRLWMIKIKPPLVAADGGYCDFLLDNYLDPGGSLKYWELQGTPMWTTDPGEWRAYIANWLSAMQCEL